MKKIGVLISSFLILGCNSNPYSGTDGTYSKSLTTQKPVIADFPIKAQSIVDATEGQTISANVRGFVQNGDGRFTFENLPTWVAFDQGQLTITPPLGTSNAVLNGEYTFNIVLTSSVDPNENYKKDMTIVVHKSAQSLQVSQFDAGAILHEGVAYSGTIKVATSYFPVQISGVNLPAGLAITSTSDATVFNVNYTPPYTAVTQSEHNNTCLESDGFTSQWCNNVRWTLTVIDSQGFAKNIAASWQIMDVRQKPMIQIVTTPFISAAQGQAFPGIGADAFTAKFAIEVVDPNGETSPNVSMQTTQSGGSFQTNVSSAGGLTNTTLPYSLVNVTWSGIPGALRGNSQSLNVNACVVGGPSQDDLCVTLPMSINL